MALSDRDRQVLHELEISLRASDRGWSRLVRRPRANGLRTGVAGLVIGLILLVVGLALGGPAGTFFGLSGLLILVSGVWFGVGNGKLRRRCAQRPRRMNLKR